MKINLSISVILCFLLLSSCEVLQQAISDSSLLGLNSSQLGVSQLLKAPSPITTSFSTDVDSELGWLDNWPEKNAHFEDANLLDRTSTGGYKLMAGLYYLDTRSYCMKAGTYGPSIGDGYVYAPLKGPKANVIKKLIRKSYDNPLVSQREVQELIWAIIAKNKFSQMPEARRRVAMTLLNPLELQQLDGGLWALAPSHVKQEAIQALAPAVQRIYKTEQNMRNLLNSNGSTYQQLEQIAVLSGVPSWGETIRPTPSGRWAFHPGGYFIRFFPRGYQQTRVELYVPYKSIATVNASQQITSINFEEEIEVEFKYYEGVLKLIEVQAIAAQDKQVWEIQGHDNSLEIGPGLLQEIGKLEMSFQVVFTSEEKQRLVDLRRLEQTITRLNCDLASHSFFQSAIGEAQRYLVYQKLLGAQVRQLEGRSKNWLSGLQGAKEQVIGFNSLRFEKKNKDRAQPNGITFEPPETVATPAVTSKQRLAVSPKPGVNHTFEIRFYGYPRGTSTYTKPDGSRHVSSSGHAFVGFLIDGKIQHVRGFSPIMGSLRGGRVTARTDERYLVPYATTEHTQEVSREQYLAARAIRKSGYILGLNDCVTYVADVATTLQMTTPDSMEDFILLPETYVQFLRDNN